MLGRERQGRSVLVAACRARLWFPEIEPISSLPSSPTGLRVTVKQRLKARTGLTPSAVMETPGAIQMIRRRTAGDLRAYHRAFAPRRTGRRSSPPAAPLKLDAPDPAGAKKSWLPSEPDLRRPHTLVVLTFSSIPRDFNAYRARKSPVGEVGLDSPQRSNTSQPLIYAMSLLVV